MRRPYLYGLSPDLWLASAMQELGCQLAPVTLEIAMEAASVGVRLGSHDPGDSFLLATAHLLEATLITRDARILAFANANPAYAAVVRC